MAIRVGLIGVGKHGRRYAQHIREDVPALQLVALARRDAAKAAALAAEFGCRAYTDFRELVAAPDIDAVIVVVPPTLHRDVVAAATEHRRAILLEKPAAVNLAVGRELLASTRRAGVPIMVAQTLRYNAVVRAIRSALPTIGTIHSVRVSQRFEPSSLDWIDTPATSGGGMILHTGVHMFDLIRLLTGLEAARVSCEMTRVVTRNTEDNFSAVIAMEGGGMLASAVGSRATQSRCGSIEIAGARAQLAGDHVLRRAYRIEGTTMTPLEIPPSTQTIPEVLHDFADALSGGRPMPISLAEGLRAVAIAEACYRAGAAGRAIEVEAI